MFQNELVMKIKISSSVLISIPTVDVGCQITVLRTTYVNMTHSAYLTGMGFTVCVHLDVMKERLVIFVSIQIRY